MPRYVLYLAVGFLAFGLGVYFALTSYWKTEEQFVIIQKGEEIRTATFAAPKQTKNEQEEIGFTPDNSIALEKIFAGEENINYKGFNISRQNKKRKLENGKPIDVAFAVIKKNNKKISEFDSYLDDNIREIRFGLFAFLGDESNKQLVIESTANRYWRYTVINLSPRFKVLFDSNDYPLMHDLEIRDINKDGKYELIQSLSSFFYFGTSYRKGYPTIPIIFKYDKKNQKYLFANREFEDNLLNGDLDESGIEDKIKTIDEIKAKKSDTIGYSQDLFTKVMNVFLTYMYLGKEKDAWIIFEKYDLPDKEEVRGEIKKYLKNDTLYNRFHY